MTKIKTPRRHPGWKRGGSAVEIAPSTGHGRTGVTFIFGTLNSFNCALYLHIVRVQFGHYFRGRSTLFLPVPLFRILINLENYLFSPFRPPLLFLPPSSGKTYGLRTGRRDRPVSSVFGKKQRFGVVPAEVQKHE